MLETRDIFTDMERRVFETLNDAKGGLSTDAVADELGLAYKHVHKYLIRLCERGYVVLRRVNEDNRRYFHPARVYWLTCNNGGA